MATFTVCTDDLQALVSSLSGLAGELKQAGHVSLDPGAAGNPRVESKLHDFFGEWSDGMNKIERNIEGITDRLSSAAQGYDETDEAIADVFLPS